MKGSISPKKCLSHVPNLCLTWDFALSSTKVSSRTAFGVVKANRLHKYSLSILKTRWLWFSAQMWGNPKRTRNSAPISYSSFISQSLLKNQIHMCKITYLTKMSENRRGKPKILVSWSFSGGGAALVDEEEDGGQIFGCKVGKSEEIGCVCVEIWWWKRRFLSVRYKNNIKTQ